MIYDRIGIFLRNTLIKEYQSEEKEFADNLSYYLHLYRTDLKKFNETFQFDFTPEMKPVKALDIFKVFFRC